MEDNEALRKFVGLSHHSGARAVLLGLLAASDSDSHRIELLGAFGKLAGPEAVPPLIARYPEEDEDSAWMTLKALADIGTEDALGFARETGLTAKLWPRKLAAHVLGVPSPDSHQTAQLDRVKEVELLRRETDPEGARLLPSTARIPPLVDRSRPSAAAVVLEASIARTFTPVGLLCNRRASMSLSRETRRMRLVPPIDHRRNEEQTTLHAKDIMSPRFVAVPPTMLACDLLDLFWERDLRAAPVLDPGGKLLGIVSLDDILHELLGAAARDDDWEPTQPCLETRATERIALSSVDPWSCPVANIMIRPDHTVTPETPVSEVCRILWWLRVCHLPVLDQGRVVGLISSLDLCRAVVEGHTIRTPRARRIG